VQAQSLQERVLILLCVWLSLLQNQLRDDAHRKQVRSLTQQLREAQERCCMIYLVSLSVRQERLPEILPDYIMVELATAPARDTLE